MDPTIAIILGAILGALLAGPITYHYSKRLIQQSYKNTIEVFKRQTFDVAAAKFRTAFLSEILYLRYDVKIKGAGTSDRINEFLNSAIFKHMEALIQFEHLLNAREREGMYRAWDEYCHPEGIPEDKYEKRDFRFDGYATIEDSKGEEEAKKIALQNIYKILDFADFKKPP